MLKIEKYQISQNTTNNTKNIKHHAYNKCKKANIQKFHQIYKRHAKIHQENTTQNI